MKKQETDATELLLKIQRDYTKIAANSIQNELARLAQNIRKNKLDELYAEAEAILAMCNLSQRCVPIFMEHANWIKYAQLIEKTAKELSDKIEQAQNDADDTKREITNPDIDKLRTKHVDTCTKRTDPNDKVIKRFLDEIGEGQKEMVVDETANNDKRKEKVLTIINQGLVGEAKEKWENSFDAEEKEILIACMSEYHNIEGVKPRPGTLTTTVDTIYRTWVGGDTRLQPSNEIRQKILRTLAKGRGISVRIDFTEYAKAYGLSDGEKPVIFEGAVLPNDIVTNVNVDGKITDVVRIFRQSPYFETAKAKNQLLTYPKAYLSTGKTKIKKDDETGKIKGGNSKRNDEGWRIVKPKILRRILETRKGKTDKTMLYEWIYKACNLEDGSLDKKLRIRKKVHAFFDELVLQGVIKKWETVKKGAALYSIKWTFAKAN